MEKQRDTTKETGTLRTKKVEAVRAKEVGKGNRRMPWLSKAKKDVISCDKLRGGANDL